MDASFILNTVLNGVMNSRRKRSQRAKHYLTGRAGSFLSNPATLMTAAGLAWGVFESLQAQASAGKPGPAANPLIGTPPTPNVAAPDATPPVTPDTAPAMTPDAAPAMAPYAAPAIEPDAARAALDPAALRMIRVAISAANADGSLSERERAAILQQAAAGDAADLVEAELRQPQPLSSIVAGVDSPDDAATLYVLAFTILRADEQVTGAERIYLAQLAHLLRLDRDTVARLERDTSERIDVLGDQGQLGG